MPTTVQLQLNDEQLKDMTEYYLYQLKDLKEARKELEKDIADCENIIQQLSVKAHNFSGIRKEKEVKATSQLAIPEINGYMLSWPLHEKISYVLRTAESPKTTRQIFERLLSIDSSLHTDKEKSLKNVSTVLSIKNGELFQRVKNETGENAYIMK